MCSPMVVGSICQRRESELMFSGRRISGSDLSLSWFYDFYAWFVFPEAFFSILDNAIIFLGLLFLCIFKAVRGTVLSTHGVMTSVLDAFYRRRDWSSH